MIKCSICMISLSVCLTPMGLQSQYIIGDSQITTSSSEGPNMAATEGRIYGDHGWSPR